MKPYSALFEQYKKGILAENQVEELNQQLMKVYFDSKEEMKQEELEYTEDLIFELLSENKLQETYALKLTQQLETDQSLQRKYNLLKNLSDASQEAKDNRLHPATEAEIADEKEEAELREVLGEVIEKVHSEQEATHKTPGYEKFGASVKSFFESLIPPINFGQPQVQLVMVTVTIAIIAVIVWISVDPLEDNQMANIETDDSTKNTQVAITDTININNELEETQLADIEEDVVEEDMQLADSEIPDEKTLKELAKRERLGKLYAANYTTPEFEYTLLRSQTSDATDLFIRAADNFNEKDYDSCITILENLLESKSFRHPDTINEIHYYLGHSYLAKGTIENKEELIKTSRDFFKQVKDRYLIRQATWFALLASMELGKKEESLSLLDTLIQLQYPENIEVVRDSVLTIFDN